MNERIKELRKLLNLSQEEFGKKLGVTRGAITNIELNKTEPKPLFVDLICEVFDVNKEWIEKGEGEPFKELTLEEEIAEFVGELLKDKNDSFKKKFIGMLCKLDEAGWEALESVAKSMGEIKNG